MEGVLLYACDMRHCLHTTRSRNSIVHGCIHLNVGILVMRILVQWFIETEFVVIL
jgi:hypothetical protein